MVIARASVLSPLDSAFNSVASPAQCPQLRNIAAGTRISLMQSARGTDRSENMWTIRVKSASTHAQLSATLMRRGLASSVFGIVSLSTPFFRFASILEQSNSRLRVN